MTSARNVSGSRPHLPMRAAVSIIAPVTFGCCDSRKVIVRQLSNARLQCGECQIAWGKAPNHSFEIGEHSIAPLLCEVHLTVVA